VPPTGSTPVQVVPGIDNAVGVAVSYEHACAFTSSGDVYCWGSNQDGQSGPLSAPDGTCRRTDITSFDPCQPQATHIDGIEHVIGLALERDSSCALIDDGSVRCWGMTADALTYWVGQFSGATSITSGASGPCAVLADGGLKCSYPKPEFANLNQIRGLALSSGYNPGSTSFSCALGPNGEVSCSGDDSCGQLGDNQGTAANVLPSGMKALVAGDVHACALDAAGQVWCWGENSDGAVGTYPLASFSCRAGTSEPSPLRVEGVPPLVSIGAGGSTTCGFAADETLWCWGTGTSVVGAPLHMPGPWEPGGDACSSAIAYIESQRHQDGTNCTLDSDCVAVPLDVSCDHTCAYAGVPRKDSQALIATLNQIEAETCSAAADAGCLSPQVTCADEQLRAVCFGGICAIDNPTRTGCTDECACGLQRDTIPIQSDPLCAGYEILIEGSGTCSQCDGIWVYLVIGNEGDSRFDGHVTLSFTPYYSPSAPAPMDLDLSLGPGEATDLIRIDNATPGFVQATVVADGNCYPTQLSSMLNFPDPATTCP
jgi:hypothetical protein